MNWLNIIRTPDYASVLSDTNWQNLERQDTSWTGKNVLVETKSHDNIVSVSVSAPKTTLSYIKLRWNLNIPRELKILGDHWERAYGDLEWRGIVPERVMPWYFLAFDGTSTNACGVSTEAAAFCFWGLDSQGVTLWLDTRNGGNGVKLGERTLHLADIIGHAGDKEMSPFSVAKTFCRKLCSSPRLPDHPVYGGNNWYYSYGKSSSDEILNNAALVAELSEGEKNRPYMLIDAGWQARALSDGHACGGPWDRGNSKFADMQGLAAKIREMDVRPGLWIRPLVASPEDNDNILLPASRALPDNDGLRILDPSLPEVQERVYTDFRRIRNWGYNIIKHDFSSYDILGRWGFEMGHQITNPGWNFIDQSKTTVEIIRNLYKHMREGADNSLLIGCNTINHLSAGFFEIQRTGDDTSGLEWERTRKMGVNTLAFRLPQHGAFFISDADCVGLTKNIPWELNKQWLELLALSGTPLFVSADPEVLKKPQKQAIRKAFSIAANSKMPNAFEPVDWMNTTCPQNWQSGDEAKAFCWQPQTGPIL